MKAFLRAPWTMRAIRQRASLLGSTSARAVSATPAPPLREASVERRAREAEKMKPAALAFLGDAVWQLACCERSVFPVCEAWNVRDADGEVSRLKCAEAQSLLVARLLGGGFVLDERERDWVRRGRNSVKKVPSRIPPEIYRDATGMEVLLGYLHVTDTDRLAAALDFVFDASVSLPSEKELLEKRHDRRFASRQKSQRKDVDADLRKRLKKRKFQSAN